MSEPTTKTDERMIVTMTVAELRDLIRSEITAAMMNGNGNGAGNDVLLNAEKTAKLMDVNVRWLYRHANKFPFTRRISRKNLRFAEAGLRRWIAAKKPGSRG